MDLSPQRTSPEARGGASPSSEATADRGDLEIPALSPGPLDGVEAIVHLAALFRTEDEDAIWQADRDGTRNRVSAAKTHPAGARFIMADTGHVYDDDQMRPGKEGDRCPPAAANAAGKLAL